MAPCEQGGNVWEWNEAVFGPYRGLRGASFSDYDIILRAANRNGGYPAYEDVIIGFRVAEVSEQAPVPAVSEWGMVTMALLALTAGTLVWASRRTSRVAG